MMVSKKDLKKAFDTEKKRQGELNADILDRLESFSQKFTSFDERLNKLEDNNTMSNKVNKNFKKSLELYHIWNFLCF